MRTRRLVRLLAACCICFGGGAAGAVTCTSDFASALAVESIKDVQTKLADRGYRPGPPDGKLGRRTCRAVLAFQHDAKLPKDGIVNPALQQRLHFADTRSRQRR